MKEINLTENLEKEIFNTSSDLTERYAEIALDNLINESLLSEIDFVKTLVSFYKISSSIIDRHNVKKILTFLSEFHSNKIDKIKLEKFKNKFDKNKKHKNQVLETILLLNEKFIDIRKSQIFANLFSAHINEKLNWEEFQKMSFMLTNLNPAGYKFLEKTANKDSKTKLNMTQHAEGQALLLACGLGTTFEDRFYLTKTGEKLYEYGLKTLIEKQSAQQCT